jgi:hypothetical protein
MRRTIVGWAGWLGGLAAAAAVGLLLPVMAAANADGLPSGTPAPIQASR